MVMQLSCCQASITPLSPHALQAQVDGRHPLPELRQDWKCGSCSTSNSFWRVICFHCKDRNPNQRPLWPVSGGHMLLGSTLSRCTLLRSNRGSCAVALVHQPVLILVCTAPITLVHGVGAEHAPSSHAHTPHRRHHTPTHQALVCVEHGVCRSPAAS